MACRGEKWPKSLTVVQRGFFIQIQEDVLCSLCALYPYCLFAYCLLAFELLIYAPATIALIIVYKKFGIRILNKYLCRAFQYRLFNRRVSTNILWLFKIELYVFVYFFVLLHTAYMDILNGNNSAICLSCYNPSIGQTGTVPQNSYHRG